jgi:hypothetical protein
MTSRGKVSLGGFAVALVAALAILPASAPAAPVTAIGGYDHYAGPFGQRTDGVLGGLVVGAGGGDVTLAGVRFDDTAIGTGFNVTGGVGVPLAPVATLRVAGTRFVGDETFRAWRAKVGPQFNLPGDRTVTVSYAHYQDNLASRSHGAIAEATTPLVPHLGGKASASYASTASGPAALQGSVGVSWSPVTRFELSGEVGMSRNAAGTAGQPFPNPGLLDGLPIVGGGPGGSGNTEASSKVEGTVLLGVRVAVP